MARRARGGRGSRSSSKTCAIRPCARGCSRRRRCLSPLSPASATSSLASHPGTSRAVSTKSAALPLSSRERVTRRCRRPLPPFSPRGWRRANSSSSKRVEARRPTRSPSTSTTSLPRSSRAFRPRRPEMHDFASRRVELGDTTLEVLAAGTGTLTFVCTHPYLDANGPHPGGVLTDALADAGRTLYLVPRGTGGSDPERDPTKLGLMQIVEDLEWLRGKLGIEPWIVCGTSPGGMTAIEYAARYPGATRGLVSVGGAASWRFLEDPACIYNPANPQAWREEEARQALDGSEEANRRWISTVLELSLERKELLGHMVERANISGPRLERVREELIGAWDREQELSDLALPALIACGRHDTQ